MTAITARFRYMIRLLCPRLLSTAINTVLKKLTIRLSIWRRKYPTPTVIRSSGVLKSRRNGLAKGIMVTASRTLNSTAMAYSVLVLF